MRRPQLFGKTLFVDFLMSNLAILLGIMMLANVSHKRKKVIEDPRGLGTEGKYAVVMQWPATSQDDVDLYVRDPAGNIVFFNARELGQMHLEHDDRGARTKADQSSSQSTPARKHEERVILRGTAPGEYVVNVHMYNKRDETPTPVHVRLIMLQGVDAESASRDLVLAANGAEATAFRFTLAPDGIVKETNQLERRLTGGGQGDPMQIPGGGP